MFDTIHEEQEAAGGGVEGEAGMDPGVGHHPHLQGFLMLPLESLATLDRHLGKVSGDTPLTSTLLVTVVRFAGGERVRDIQGEPSLLRKAKKEAMVGRFVG